MRFTHHNINPRRARACPELHGMETALMNNFGRKAAIAAVAFATVGSTVFGGVALANDAPSYTGGEGGEGGGAGTFCYYAPTAPVLTTIAPVFGAPQANNCPATGGDANGAPGLLAS
jgi:hypothetical protein